MQSDELRVISYMQATTQVILNLSTLVKTDALLDHFAALLNGFCEYLIYSTPRIKSAAFRSMKLAIEYCVKPEFFQSTS